MDPNATLREMLALAVAIDLSAECLAVDGPSIDDVQRLAELVMAMDGWLQGGGALPQRWASGLDAQAAAAMGRKGARAAMAKRTPEERSAIARKGGLVGSSMLTPEQRRERAMKAVAARQAKKR